MKLFARTLACAGVLACLQGAAAGDAQAPAAQVSIQFQAFGPGQLDVLPGESVVWSNLSERRHTVNADDDSFASGDLVTGQTFTRTFDAVGAFPYHCTVHPGMVGEIDVRAVTLGPLPTAPVPAGAPVRFDGRTATPDSPVRIERASGAAWTLVATASPGPDGAWHADLSPTSGGDYRASTEGGTSQTRRLLVIDRRITVRPTRRGIAVTVTPSLPYGRLLVQEYRRDHFGWWPLARGRLDYVSEASFRVRRPARIRVLLVAPDGWTPLVAGRIVALGR